MPVIPFGAICYFGSNAKISYKRYIFTCITGTIPSILTSIFLGRIISIAIIEKIPAYIVILSIIGVMILLLIAGIFILNKTVLKDFDKSEFLAIQVKNLYTNGDKTQQEIADIFNISRRQVSRYLKK